MRGFWALGLIVALSPSWAEAEERKEVASVDPGTLVLPVDASSESVADKPASEKKAPVPEKKKIGVGFGVTLGSADNFRGLNLYKSKNQLDAALQIAPWVSYSLPKTGLTATYWSSYQGAGAAAALNRKAGLSHEQDFILGYRFDLPGHIALTPGWTTYIYPFATKEAAGTTTPVYIEPSVDFLWASGVVDLDLQTTYYHGVQSALKNYRYGYLHAQVGRTTSITPWIGIEAALGYGHKLYVEKVTDNRDDVSARIGVPITLSDAILKPAVNWAWTNLKGQPLGHEYFIFGSLDASYAL